MPGASPQFPERARGTLSQNYVHDAAALNQPFSPPGSSRQKKSAGDATGGATSLDKFMPKSCRDSNTQREKSSPSKLNKGR